MDCSGLEFGVRGWGSCDLLVWMIRAELRRTTCSLSVQSMDASVGKI